MKATLFSIGTRGDIEPFLAAADILRQRGWEVICVFPEQFREEVEKLGFRFDGFSREFLDLLQNQDAQQVLGGGSTLGKVKSWILLARSGMRITSDSNQMQYDVLAREQPDLVVYHPKCLFILLWSMANPGRSVVLSPVPGVVHPLDDASPMFGDHGRTLNRVAFSAMTIAKSLAVRNFGKKFRKHFPNVRLSISNIKRAMLETERTVYTVSPSLFPKPAHWPEHAEVVGYFERDKTLDWQPSEELLDFLDRHQRIVFISFGSMTNPDPRGRSELIVKVLRKLDIPAIINTSWGGLQKVEAPEHVMFVDSIPYDWLFPRVSAVVHHGGSGTTHMATKYGLPSLVIPHAVDQFFWDRTIARLGLGPAGIRVSKLNESGFEERLLQLLNDPAFAENARKTGVKMRSEAEPDRLFDALVRGSAFTSSNTNV